MTALRTVKYIYDNGETGKTGLLFLCVIMKLINIAVAFGPTVIYNGYSTLK
jgi:hypothetical protein